MLKSALLGSVTYADSALPKVLKYFPGEALQAPMQGPPRPPVLTIQNLRADRIGLNKKIKQGLKRVKTKAADEKKKQARLDVQTT